MPPSFENGSETGRMTSASRISRPSMFSPTVLPVTVGRFVWSRPARASSFMTAGMPPASSSSSM